MPPRDRRIGQQTLGEFLTSTSSTMFPFPGMFPGMMQPGGPVLQTPESPQQLPGYAMHPLFAAMMGMAPGGMAGAAPGMAGGMAPGGMAGAAHGTAPTAHGTAAPRTRSRSPRRIRRETSEVHDDLSGNETRMRFPDDDRKVSTAYRSLGMVHVYGEKKATPKKFRASLCASCDSRK